MFFLLFKLNIYFHGGPERDRTVDLPRARRMLSQTELQAH